MAQDKETDFNSPRILSNNSRPPEGLQQSVPTTFSIATPTVTTILPMTENMTDTSFMLSATSYEQDTMLEKSCSSQSDTQKAEHSLVNIEKPGVCSLDDLQKNTRVNSSETRSVTSQLIDNQSMAFRDDVSKLSKKRNKAAKKSTKLDAKSKLEKSRQSARECRARKKLRYQYLEDLVCNREKAVVKLREELSMFCELSKQVDVGTISDKDRQLLVDQTKENSLSEATNFS